jgi:hypothetical protein
MPLFVMVSVLLLLTIGCLAVGTEGSVEWEIEGKTKQVHEDQKVGSKNNFGSIIYSINGKCKRCKRCNLIKISL